MQRLALVAMVLALAVTASGQATQAPIRPGKIVPGYGISMLEPRAEGHLLHMRNLYVVTPDGGNVVAEHATYNHETREVRLSGHVTLKMPSVDDHLRYTLQSAQ